MSNSLSIRRVKVQTIDKSGNPEGEPTFGVMAADGYVVQLENRQHGVATDYLREAD